jgi:hypothetical protein
LGKDHTDLLGVLLATLVVGGTTEARKDLAVACKARRLEAAANDVMDANMEARYNPIMVIDVVGARFI